MGLDYQRLFNTRFATRLGLGVIGRMPQFAGYGLANLAARILSKRRQQPFMKAISGNLAVACGEDVTQTQLDALVNRAVHGRTRALYDFYHALGDEQKLIAMVNYPENFDELVAINQRREHGAVVVMVHMGNPELLAIAGPLKGLRGIALTFPGENGGYQLLNEIRDRVGIQAIPTTMASLKTAANHLKAKGAVFTGLERPLPGSGYTPKFFGRPTPLPVHHVMLALKADVPIIIFAGKRRPDGRYDLLVSNFITMERCATRKEELLVNTERLLKVAEGFIRQAPEQWVMLYPLWPEETSKSMQ